MNGADNYQPAAASQAPILRLEDLAVYFPVRGGVFHRSVSSVKAVDGISFDVQPGEILGLVGESGCGKSTTARAIVRLVQPTSGRIVFGGRDLATLRGSELKEFRSHVQFVFQDPYASLNPRATVHQILAEPLRAFGRYRNGGAQRIAQLMDMVGLASEHESRHPHAFSGGQRQRIGIARALALDPQLVVLDEPVSALDVSIQAQVINLLQQLQDDLGLTYVFVSHDLSLIRHISDRVAIMYLGHIMEIGPAGKVFANPTHPYTKALLSATPIAHPRDRGSGRRIVLEGDVPSPMHPPSGCPFRTRCWKATSVCAEKQPPLELRSTGQYSACFHPEEPTAQGGTAADLLLPIDDPVH